MANLFTRIREVLRRYFVAGILLFAPLAITIWAIAWIIQRLDNLLLPHVLHLVLPGLEEAPRIPLVGAVFTLLVILLFGIFARHLFGMELVRISERVLRRVPVARSIYAGVKQLLEAIFFSSTHTSFRRVVLVQYPRQGVYAIAFTTGPARGPIQDATAQDMVNCFVPTTPNPTSGFYLLVPDKEVIEVDLSVEEAFKLVMSAGLVAPEGRSDPSQAANAALEVPAGEARGSSLAPKLGR
jgi:uncharacterized membrane protein